MILVGLQLKWTNCAGYSDTGYTLWESADIHEASESVLRSQWTNPWQGQFFEFGEFHDTQTGKTWSVDAGGHTQKDYRDEKTDDFRKRWSEKVAQTEIKRKTEWAKRLEAERERLEFERG